MKRLIHVRLTLWILGWCASGCAGPMTPLGAVWSLDGPTTRPAGQDSDAVTRQLASGEGVSSRPVISFDPPRQVLHGPYLLRLVIEDPAGVPEDYDLNVRYGGHDVTRGFLMQAKVVREQGSKRLVLEVPSVRLAPRKEHLIEVGYRSPAGKSVMEKLGSPVCRAFDHAQLRWTEGFNPSEEQKHAIEELSRQLNFNPAFTAALVAGARERKGEEKLETEKSLKAALSALQVLSERWQDSVGFSKVRWTGNRNGGEVSDAEVARTRLMLASYFAGYGRVLAAIDQQGPSWLKVDELKDAQRFVNRVFSYCDYFAKER